MTRVIQCPHCRAAGDVPNDAVGKSVRCSGCGGIFVVPRPRFARTREIRRIVVQGFAIFAKTVTVITDAAGASPFLRECRRQVGISFRILLRALWQFPGNQNFAAGAALSFYAVFAIVPLVFLAVVSCGFFFGQDQATHQVEGWMKKAIGEKIGEDNADDFEEMLDAIKTEIGKTITLGRFWTRSFWLLAGSIVIHITGVLALFSQARAGLCVIWKIHNTQTATLRWIIFDYVLSLLMVLFLIAVLFTSLFIGMWLPDIPFLGDGISFVLLAAALGVTYRVMSVEYADGGTVSWRIPWRYVWYGSAITSILFLVGNTLMQQYLLTLYDSPFYGRGGFLIIFLLWVYYYSQVFFFGAELMQARLTRQQWLPCHEPA